MNDAEESVGYHWTNHPLVDFGIATLMTYCKVSSPEQLTYGRLRGFADWAIDSKAYFRKPYLAKSVLFSFPNLVNPSPKVTYEAHKTKINLFLRGFDRQEDLTLPFCTFFQRPSVGLVARDTFPLLMGQESINFYPGGQKGLPVSGLAMTAIQAVIFGAPRSGSRLIVLETDKENATPKLLLEILQGWIEDIKPRILLSQLDNETKLPDFGPARNTLIDHLVSGARKLVYEFDTSEETIIKYRGGATIYYFTNYGQNPALDLYSLKAPALRFVQHAQLAKYQSGWNEVRRRGWPKPKKDKKAVVWPPVNEPSTKTNTNNFFNALYNLPQASNSFVRQYLVSTTRALILSEARSSEEQLGLLQHKLESVSKLTDLFLKEVLEMKPERLRAIKELGNRMAEIVWHNRPRYRDFVSAYKLPQIMRVLRLVSGRELEDGNKPLFGLGQAILIFDVAEEAPYVDYKLAWDLVLIHMMEQLFERDPQFFGDPQIASNEEDKITFDEQALADASNEA